LLYTMRRRDDKRSSRVLGSLVATVAVGLVVLGSSGWLAFRLLHPGQQRTVDKDVKLVPSVIAGERSLMVAEGSVDAEVDFSQLGADAVHVSGDRRSVEVTLPPAQLSATHLDHDHTYVAERQRGLIDRIGQALSSNPGDDHALLQAADQKLRDAAEDTQLRQRAEDNTRTMLTGLLNSLGYEHVTVRFAVPAKS
jgi:hypothetical protein